MPRPSRPRSRVASKQMTANKLDYMETMSNTSHRSRRHQPEARFADQAATLARSWVYSTSDHLTSHDHLPSKGKVNSSRNFHQFLGPGPPPSLLGSSVDSMSRCESPANTLPVCQGVVTIPPNDSKYPNFGYMCNK